MDDVGFEGLSTEARAVLAAALDGFAEFGYHGTTTRTIAKAANKSATAIYTHYPSKRELLFQIIIRAHQDLLDTLLAARALADTPTGQLSNVARAHAEFHAEHNAIARVANYDLRNLEPSALDEVLAIRRQIEDMVRGTIRAGTLSGEFMVDDENLAASAMLSMGIDVSRWYRSSGRLSVTDIGDHYAHYALRMVGCAASADFEGTARE